MVREAMETEATANEELEGGGGAGSTSSDSHKPIENEEDARTTPAGVPQVAEPDVIREEPVVGCNDGVVKDIISPDSIVASSEEEEDEEEEEDDDDDDDDDNDVENDADDDDDDDDDDEDVDDAREQKGDQEETLTRTYHHRDTAHVTRLATTSCDLDVVMAIRTLEAVEKDAHAISDSLCSLLSSLQSGLSKVTTSSVDHLQCYNEVAGHVQEAALDAASKGNKFINTCLRVNEEMKGMHNMAAQLKVLRQIVDHLDNQVSRFLPR